MKHQLSCQTQIFFMSLLPLFKSIFEQKELLIHRPDTSHGESFCAFFGCFVKFEVINNTLYNKVNLMLQMYENCKKLYAGDENEKLVSSLEKNKIGRETATDFYTKVHTAYVTAIYT